MIAGQESAIMVVVIVVVVIALLLSLLREGRGTSRGTQLSHIL